MKFRIIALLIILSFIVPVISITGTAQVYAGDEEQQLPQEQTVIAPDLEEILSGMSPTDNIAVIVWLRGDPTLDQKIQDIWQGQPDDEMHELQDQQRKNSIQYCWTDPAIAQRLNELHTAKSRQVIALLEQAYSEMIGQVQQKIEQLPDTIITSSCIAPPNLVVETQVGNIDALASIPEVVGVYDNPTGGWIGPFNWGVELLSPPNGSFGCRACRPYFSWEPYKEATKYKFVLASNLAITQIIDEIEVDTTSYRYNGMLDYNTNYFWRVMGIEPAPTDWSATFSFQTEAAPPPPPEAPPQPTVWHPALIAGLIIALAGAVGFASWFFVARSHRAK